MIEHRGLVNYSFWAKKMYIQSQEESFALYSSLSFDLTVTSIFAPLISGNRVEIYYDDGSEFILYKILKENKVNIIKLTPAHLSLLKDRDNNNSSVKRFIVGGENLKVTLAASVYESFGGEIEIFNEYGPTETVVGCMIHKYNYHNDKGISVPIGLPADNVQVYILDSILNIVPYGKIGELYIAGDGVARGYLNQEELTKNRFIKNPFTYGQVMYKTGDTAIYRKDGTIEYIGRKDNQVKIRGHRIELEEIENHLLNIKNIIEAVVIDREDSKGDKKLYAYIISMEEIPPHEIKKYLSKVLPNYMIPSHFVLMDKIPLTPNGKVNTKLLPEPKDSNNVRLNIIEPRNETEKKLLNIIQEILDVNEISISDNFYELGGDSIKAIQIVSKLNNEGINLKVKDLLSSADIGEIAAALRIEEDVQVSQDNCEGIVGNTPIYHGFLSKSLSKLITGINQCY
jgi:acyl-coenzyme A synthetase/AMP-(fatty) acid ligase/acyl carrier protein